VTSAYQQDTIECIHASGTQLVVAVTGGGSGAISALLEVPGASAAMLEAVVPYSQASLEQWLGGAVDQACSERTARAMAMAAFERARTLSTLDPHRLCGIGATASLASNRPKRGPHRVHVAWQSAEMTASIFCEFEKYAGARQQEERAATLLILDAVAEACGVDTAALTDLSLRAKTQRREERAPTEWTELLLGQRASVTHGKLSSDTSQHAPAVLFPGAFNPLHDGHAQMAEVAAARCHAPVTFELSIANVDKPSLDFIELANRLKLLAPYRVLITRSATFVEKAQLAPGCIFIVGVDTIERIADPRYYHGDSNERDAAIATIARSGCRFLVFGRRQGERFCSLADVHIPVSLRALCDEVPEADFRADVSSTELRQEVQPSRGT
jgi:nicotinamide mononucleotide (NMN) deamidase PncC/nicotinic acid mononucleotide adenylyltransferase